MPIRRAITPLREHDAQEQEQHDRHVPQVAFFDRRDAAAGVFHVIGKRRDRLRRVIHAAGFFGDAAQQRRAHRRVEIFAVARRHAHVADVRPERRARAGGLDPRLIRAIFARRKRAAVFAVALAGPLQWHVDRLSLGPGDVRHHAGVVHFQEARVGDFGDQRDRLARLDLLGRAGQLHLIGNAVDEPSHELTPVRFMRHVLDRRSWRPSATPMSRRSGRRASCRGRSADTQAQSIPGRFRRLRAAATSRPASPGGSG